MHFRFLLVVAVVLFAEPVSFPQQPGGELWHFAVSGDSRNCGDVVMPAIARSVLEQQNVAFYWHLGDFRLMSGIDEDMRHRYGDRLTLADYWRDAWGDFLANQIAPFGLLRVHLGIGNHELYGNKTETDYLNQFAYWLDTPELRTQRLNEYAQDGTLKTYHHWKERSIDFIYLDNSGEDGFDGIQLKWFEGVLASDRSDNQITTVVVSMHRALPNSYACGHSMNGDADHPSEKGTTSGRRAYSDLVQWKNDAKKYVYILASHSHFFMQDIFETAYWKNPEHGGVALPGWIVGTAGARRYALPREVPQEILHKLKARTCVSGYLLATVHSDGSIMFEFKEVTEKDLPDSVRTLYGNKFVKSCFLENRDDRPHPPPASCREK